MPSLSTGILLLSVLLLLLLRNAHCLSEGERCNRFASNECEQGLACVAVGTDSSVAHCARKCTSVTVDRIMCKCDHITVVHGVGMLYTSRYIAVTEIEQYCIHVPFVHCRYN